MRFDRLLHVSNLSILFAIIFSKLSCKAGNLVVAFDQSGCHRDTSATNQNWAGAAGLWPICSQLRSKLFVVRLEGPLQSFATAR